MSQDDLPERDLVVQRLGEIKAERDSIPEKPAGDAAQRTEVLDRESTGLVRQLVEKDPT
jgi:hypothetical protein